MIEKKIIYIIDYYQDHLSTIIDYCCINYYKMYNNPNIFIDKF